MSLNELIESAEEALSRSLAPDELAMVGRLHEAGKGLDEVLAILSADPEPVKSGLGEAAYVPTAPVPVACIKCGRPADGAPRCPCGGRILKEQRALQIERQGER